MRLVYWMAECRDDSPAYNIRARTKREALRLYNLCGGPEGYGPVRKVVCEYSTAHDGRAGDRFSLLLACLEVDGARWER